MKKFLSLLAVVALVVSMTVSPVFAGGDKNRGDVGAGEVDQGDNGVQTGNAPSDPPGVAR